MCELQCDPRKSYRNWPRPRLAGFAFVLIFVAAIALAAAVSAPVVVSLSRSKPASSAAAEGGQELFDEAAAHAEGSRRHDDDAAEGSPAAPRRDSLRRLAEESPAAAPPPVDEEADGGSADARHAHPTSSGTAITTAPPSRLRRMSEALVPVSALVRRTIRHKHTELAVGVIRYVSCAPLRRLFPLQNDSVLAVPCPSVSLICLERATQHATLTR